MRYIIVLIIFVFMMLTVFVINGFALEKIPVFVSIVPQKTFVQQIGQDLVTVQVMVEPGASPATYEPKPRQMASLSKTRIYYAIGVPFENTWLKKIAAANPKMEVVHTDQDIEKRAMAVHHHDDGDEQGHGQATHSEEEGHDHEHDAQEGLDPHIWLSPPLVKIQARTILKALQMADPTHQDDYKANFDQFIVQIDQLHRDLKETFAPKRGLRFMVFHPSWGYFADAYGLEQVPIEIEGKSPKSAQLQMLIRQARKGGIRTIFVQPQFSTKSARLIAKEIDGEVVSANPLAENWFANLRAVAGRFEAVLK